MRLGDGKSMPSRGQIAKLKARVEVYETEYDEALGYLRTNAETKGMGEQARWFATLTKFPDVSDKLVRAYREYAQELEKLMQGKHPMSRKSYG
jgi:hypothetical protein